VSAKPVITTQPKTQAAGVGGTVTFKVVATGAESYQWQYSTNSGSTWHNSSSTTSTLSFTATTAMNGRQYRCVVTNAYGSTTSNAATLTVSSLPVIVTQPKAKTVDAGATVAFSVEASGSGLTYQWQYSTNNGSTWHNASGTSATFSFKATAALSGRQYRCVVTNANGSTPSNGATLTVNSMPVITAHPVSVSAKCGTVATFSVTATGGSLTYQWQVSTNGSTWTDATGSGSTTATLTVAVAQTMNGNKYRCVVTNSTGTVTSNEAMLTVTYG
jgi:hypothetical protein